MGLQISHLQLDRRAALIGAAAFAAGCAAEAARAPRVLFVCQYGTVKSPIAREHCRRMAQSRGLVLEAASRGVTPEDRANAQLLVALEQDGIDIRSEPIVALTLEDRTWADIIVSFDSLPRYFAAEARDWSGVPSMNADYLAARADLLPRIDALLDEIQRA